jgi:hypothetical protein
MLKRVLMAAAFCALPALANASAIIADGNVMLGVDDFGQLNISGGVADVSGETRVGTRWLDGGVEYESTSHGCLCEGWGLAVDGTSGFANNSVGSGGLTAVSFVSDASTATSVVQIIGTDVYVTHSFALSASDDLYEAVVTIENRGVTDVAALEYRRTMDWDTSPTPFDEYVTIGGTATTTLLAESSDNGFSSSDPLVADINDLAGCGITTDFSACGPSDHGAVFDFALGALAAGEEFEFSVFYGGAEGKADADAALAAVGAELFSYGWSRDDVNQDGRGDAGTGNAGALTPTFIFAFKGVGGSVIIPPTSSIPLPAGVWLMIAGIGALGGMRRLKQRKAA